jgi:hypothetical protein
MGDTIGNPAPGALARSTAAIADLLYGHRDDPGGREGLSALVARWIAGGTLPGRLGWRTRHRLEAYASSFSYWTATGDLERLPGHLSSRLHPPPPDRLAELKAAQSRLLRRRTGNLYLRMLDAVDEAAHGPTGSGPLGDETSIAGISAAEVADHLDRCRSTGIVVYHSGGPAPARIPRADRHDDARADRHDGGPAGRRGGRRVWCGGVIAAPVPGETRTRVAVRIPLRADARPPGALPLLVELLGTGAEGRLIRRLRRDRSLAYGVAALSWDAADGAGAAPSVGGYALVEPEHAAEAAEVLLDTVREAAAQAPSAELAAAARRCRTLLLVQADEPFGAVTEQRTLARDGTSLARLADDVAHRARHGLDLVVDETAPPAMAITGAVRPDQLARIECRV